MKIKQTLVTKYPRNGVPYKVDLFEPYQIGTNSGNTITIRGPKRDFILRKCIHTVKIYRPEQPVKELPLFYVCSQRDGEFPKVSKIQGANYFVLDNEELIPYKGAGRGSISPLIS